MKSSLCRSIFSAAVLCLLVIPTAAVCPSFCLAQTDGPWPWAGKYDNRSVTLLLLGDFNVQKRDDPASALIHVRETLNRADLVYANLEGLPVKSKGPDKDIPGKSGWQHPGPESVLALKAANIEAVGVANNVAYGPENIMKTLSVLDANGIAHAGGGRNIDEAHQPAIVERKGLRVGFLQYTAKWYEEEKQIATADASGVARVLSRDGLTIEPSDLGRLFDDIRRLRSRVDIVIVSAHTRDGQNRSRQPVQTAVAKLAPPPSQDLFSRLPVDRRLNQLEPYQRELAHAAIDAGADVVFGHGCHMLQAVEVYKGKPILYCLGNFASDWIRVRNYRDGMVARIVMEGKEVERVSLVPVTRDEEDNNVLMLDPSAGEGAKLLRQLKDLSPGVALKVDSREVVLIDKQGSGASHN
jgi:poly-gamma-glutamate capsule biosynthesis protein CapA/YwtB (metallophosphatase superfamily)